MPGYCPGGADGSPCCLKVHCLRTRKTGPGYPLTIIVCTLHHRYYTLYPPGYTPYGRAKVAPVNDYGRVIPTHPWDATMWACLIKIALEEQDTSRTDMGETAWSAARQAACRCLRWLGLDTPTVCFETARLLDVSLHIYAEAHHLASSAGSLRQRAKAIHLVIDAMTLDNAIQSRLLLTGHHTQSVGCGWLWRPGQGTLRLFCSRERAPPKATAAHAPASTT